MNETRNRILLFLFPLLLMAGCGHRETAPNIVLVTLDTTRPDYLGCYGNDWVETPTLDRVASEGVLFEDAVCQIPTTLSSHTAILTSLYPRTSGVRSGVVIVPDEVTTLAEHLKTQGYQTAAFVAAAVLEKKYNLDQGLKKKTFTMTAPSIRLKDRLPRLTKRFSNGWRERMTPKSPPSFGSTTTTRTAPIPPRKNGSKNILPTTKVPSMAPPIRSPDSSLPEGRSPTPPILNIFEASMRARLANSTRRSVNFWRSCGRNFPPKIPS
ncbi:MAG: sulfatase-like hydrolase/transferase [Candidatus Omnitrophica bacterium]|nr:sulfatase-like hydrolase/transferase [Candidatus Omnitrophota bacterium]